MYFVFNLKLAKMKVIFRFLYEKIIPWFYENSGKELLIVIQLCSQYQ